MDINQYTSNGEKFESSSDVANKIARGYKATGYYGAFGVKIITTGHNPNIKDLTDKINQWKLQRPLRKLSINDPALNSLAMLAAKYGDITMIQRLQELNVNFKTISFNNVPIMFLGLNPENSTETIRALHKAGADLNARAAFSVSGLTGFLYNRFNPEQEYTPSFEATMNGNLPAIKILYELGANFKSPFAP